jgi:hypothetical protein
MKSTLLGGMVALALLGGAGVMAKDTEKEKPRPRMGPRKVLTQFDTNKNGKIDGAEAVELRKAFDGDLKSQLASLDRDGNGKLDETEIAAIKITAAPTAGGVAPPKNGGRGKSATAGTEAE